MRLINYLNEEIIFDYNHYKEISTVNKTKELLLRDCKKFLSIIKGKSPLYRGIERDFSLAKFKSKLSNRKPTDMPLNHHKALNIIFTKVYGWPVRNGVFASSDKDQVDNYGTAYKFYPIGNFKFIYSHKIADLFNFINLSTSPFDSEDSENMYADLIINPKNMTSEFKEIYGKSKQYLAKKVKEARNFYYNFATKYYTDKDLNKAIKSGNEISFNCEEYYLVDPYLDKLIWEK